MFPQNEENMPVLRFADFSEPWEQRKLGDTVQITMGQSPNGENYTDNPRDHILVQGNADMKNGRVCPRVWTTQVTKKADPEDIILSVRAPVGDVGRTDYTVVLGRGVAGIKGNAFIFQTLSRMKEQGFWTRYSSGSTFESINSADLKDAFIQICHIEEQTKIGDFFTKLDDTIALHQRKLTLFNQLKETYLKQMFPQNEENMPVLRFADFSEPWEQRKWSETVDISTEMVNPKTGEYDSLPHIGPGNIESFTGRILDNVKSVKEDNLISGKFHFYPGDVIYGKINPQLGKYAMVDFEGLASADSYVLNTKNGVSQTFLFTILQGTSFYKYSVSVSMRTGMPKINRDELNQYSYSAPSIVEQEKIGHFFQQLDDTSALHQEKIAHLKVLKTTLLNKMFI